MLTAYMLLMPTCDASFFEGPTEAPIHEEPLKSAGKPAQRADGNSNMRQRHVLMSPQIRNGGSVKAMIKMFLSVIIDRYLNKIINMLMDTVGNEYGGGNLHGERGPPMLHSQSDAFFF